MTTCHPRNVRLRRTLLIASLLAAGMGSALAADWPAFKPGRWQFVRTMEQAGAKPEEQVTTERCFDPVAENRKQRDMLTRAGCKFSPLVQDGSKYRYSADCNMGGMRSSSNSLLDATSDEAYTITIDSVMGTVRTHEVVTARRLGDCAK
jgi:hypothetical protein